MRAHIFQMRYNNSLLQYYRNVTVDNVEKGSAHYCTNANNYSISQAWIRDLTSSRLTFLSTGHS